MTEEAPPRSHPLHDVFHGLHWLAQVGAPWAAVSPQPQCWRRAGEFEALVHDVRVGLRRAEGRPRQPSAAILDSRTLPSTPESGPRAGSDGAKRQRGSKVHRQVGQLTAQVKGGTSDAVARVAQGSPGVHPAQAAAAHGLQLAVVNLPKAKPGFVLLPSRWVVAQCRTGGALASVGSGQ